MDKFLQTLTEKRWIQRAALIIILAAALMSFYYFYLTLWPFNPVQVVQPFKVLTPVVKAGTLLKYETTFCSNSDIVFRLNRSIENLMTHDIFDLASVTIHLNHECITLQPTVPIGQIVPLGEYRLIATTMIQANSLRRVINTYNSEHFTVIAPDPINIPVIIK